MNPFSAFFEFIFQLILKIIDFLKDNWILIVKW